MLFLFKGFSDLKRWMDYFAHPVIFCFPIQSASHLCWLCFICRQLPKSKWQNNPNWFSLVASVCNSKREEASCLLLFQVTSQNNQSIPFSHQLKKLTRCLENEGTAYYSTFLSTSAKSVKSQAGARLS